MIRFTVIAAQRIKELISLENDNKKIPPTSGLKLRILAENKILLELLSDPPAGDKIISSQGINVFINQEDKISFEKKFSKGILIYWLKNYRGEIFEIQDLNKHMRYGCNRTVNIEQRNDSHQKIS